MLLKCVCSEKSLMPVRLGTFMFSKLLYSLCWNKIWGKLIPFVLRNFSVVQEIVYSVCMNVTL